MKVKISTRSLVGSTRHLTGAIKIITLNLIIITLYATSTSALTYQDSVDVSFTFDPTLSISLSSSNISIDSLSPGNYAHSNTVAINVSTNNVYGYTLTAKVGDDGGASGTSASSNLVNTSTSTSFTSLSSSDNLTLSSFSPNTWGYTTSSNINNSTTTYSGLLYNIDTTINVTRNSRGTASSSYPGTNITNFTIGASAGSAQLAGDYTNTITFTAVTNNVRPVLTLYDLVADMSKGTQTAADLQATITTPTSADRTQDTSNSGVYEYNSAVFGRASDAADTSIIYYYRGVLENEVGTYGSDGSATTYPNYAILDADGNRTTSDTCWRIVRTTGSGGVKMIYNGQWTGSTCANATTNAQITASPFNTSSATINGETYYGLQYQNMHAIGYTYSNVAPGTTTETSLSELLGSSGNDTTTNTNSSIIKQVIEDWYASNLSSYTNSLEPSAGYCNDRTVYPNGSYALANRLAEDTNVIPYGTSGMAIYYFGAYTRNLNTAQTPTLGCPRGAVDLYSTTTASGGNGQLTYPIALLTSDESSFTGSGRGAASQGSSYNANSFLRSGSYFWLLSINTRSSYGYAVGFYLGSSGDLNGSSVGSAISVRPAISLKPGITPAAGSGTATDPWLVLAP